MLWFVLFLGLISCLNSTVIRIRLNHFISLQSYSLELISCQHTDISPDKLIFQIQRVCITMPRQLLQRTFVSSFSFW
jgi:hypothetical protein